MKKHIWLATILFGFGIFLYSSCCEEEPGYCTEEGIITAVDYRECACCGGWFIEIGGDTLRAPDLPQEFKEGLDSNEFPLPVYLEWSPNETPCLGDEIEVPCIRRRN